jgi:hypothetical protein
VKSHRRLLWHSISFRSGGRQEIRLQLIGSRLDYWNALVYGASASNIAISYTTSLEQLGSRHDVVRSVSDRSVDADTLLHQLHWFLVERRIDLELMSLSHKAFHHVAWHQCWRRRPTDPHACCASARPVNSLWHHTTSAALPDDSSVPLFDFGTVSRSLFDQPIPYHHLRLDSKLFCSLLDNSIRPILFTVLSACLSINCT